MGIKTTKMYKEDKDFLVRLLPDHYTCRFRDTGINCQSNTGIDGNDTEQWDYTLKAIKQNFGKRFLEVNHITCTDHKNFTVYLKMAENELELRMEAAKEMATKSALSGVGGGELCQESEALPMYCVSTRSANELEILAEELECVNMWLSDKKAPTHDKDGEKYSTVGRIEQLLNGC